MKQKKTKKLLVALSALGFLTVGAVSAEGAGAETAAAETAVQATEEARGISNVSISLEIQGSNVFAKAKNEFMLFPSKGEVYVQLYSCEYYTENSDEMTEEACAHIDDPDIGKTLEASAATGGRSVYWRGVVKYSPDGNDFRKKETETFHILPDGSWL